MPVTGVQTCALPISWMEAEASQNRPARAAQQLVDGDNDWLVTSSEALHILLQMAGQYCGVDSVAKLQQQQLIVPHARIAETAQRLGFQHIKRSASGDESLLAALQSDT